MQHTYRSCAERFASFMSFVYITTEAHLLDDYDDNDDDDSNSCSRAHFDLKLLRNLSNTYTYI